MSSVNKAILLGNLGKDPELKFTGSGLAVCNFSIATSEKVKDQTGQYKDKVEWHRIVCFGKDAENTKKYLAKGASVYIEGKIQNKAWEDSSGQKRYTTEIIADKVSFLAKSARESEPQPEVYTQPESLDNIPF